MTDIETTSPRTFNVFVEVSHQDPYMETPCWHALLSLLPLTIVLKIKKKNKIAK